MATIRKRGNKYQVQVRRSGFQDITKTFITLKDAKEWSRHIESKQDRSELAPDRNLLKQIKLSELVARYRDEVVPHKKGAEIETIVLNAFLRNAICDKCLSEINTTDFARYRDARLSEIKPSSLKRQLAPIQNMFEIARDEWGIPLPVNPLDNLSLKAPDNRRERRLKSGEYEKLLNAARSRRNPIIEKVVIFAIETAMRRGEILALHWDEVDLERRCMTILESKNGHSRTIPLTPISHALLSEMNGAQGRVFPITSNAIKMAWGRMLKVTDIEDLNFHDLRHEAVSRFFEMGLTAPEVASISGHRDMRMLMRYAHANLNGLQVKLNDAQSNI